MFNLFNFIPGQVLIFSYLLVHGSYPNTSTNVRRMLLFQVFRNLFYTVLFKNQYLVAYPTLLLFSRLDDVSTR